MFSGTAKRFTLIVGAFVLFSAHGNAQEPNLEIELPNPDGRDPVFDQTSAGQPIAIEFSDLTDTERLSLDDFSGPLKLVNFWATWCTPCIKELPSLAALARQHSADTVQVIPISLDQKGASGVPSFIAELEVQGLDWFTDPTAASGQAADVFVLPTSVIVDGEGKELGRIVGSADWDSAEASQLINALLGEID